MNDNKLLQNFKGPASQQVTKMVKHPIESSSNHRNTRMSPYQTDNNIDYNSIFQNDLMFGFKGSNRVFSNFNNLSHHDMKKDMSPEQKVDVLKKHIQFFGVASSLAESNGGTLQPEGHIAVNYDAILNVYNGDSRKWECGELLTFALPDPESRMPRHVARFTVVNRYNLLSGVPDYNSIPDTLKDSIEKALQSEQAKKGAALTSSEIVRVTYNETILYAKKNYRTNVIAKTLEPVEQGKVGRILLICKG